MPNDKAVIFDLDNTILDRVNTFRRFAEAFVGEYFEHSSSAEQVVQWIIELDQDGYKDKKELFAELLEEYPREIKTDINALMTYYQVHYVRNALLMEHALETIRYLRLKRYRIGLVTNGRTDIQFGKIDLLGIRDEFDAILVSEEVGIKKPDRRIFELAAARLELMPEQCVYIGDHPVNDIEGAGKAGMDTIWFKVNQPWKPEVKVKPRYVIHHLSELTELL